MVKFLDLKKINDLFYSEFIEVFNTVLKSGWFILGDEVNEFEKQFASFCDVNHCIGVANGLDALILILEG